ncbi:hypothetical protein ACNKHV_04400 [Shigella flexneri]
MQFMIRRYGSVLVIGKADCGYQAGKTTAHYLGTALYWIAASMDLAGP